MNTSAVRSGAADARRAEAFNVRVNAANIARNRPLPVHKSNGDEQLFPSLVATFTKGLAHDRDTGLISDTKDFVTFVQGIDKPTEELIALIPLGPNPKDGFLSGVANAKPDGKPTKVRGWESMGAGSTFDLEGPDAQAVAMPPAPAILSDELHLEMAEVFWQALLREVHFNFFSDIGRKVIAGGQQVIQQKPHLGDDPVLVDKAIAGLNDMAFIKKHISGLTPAEEARKRSKFNFQTLFRGITPGDDVGPYLSQFLIIGNEGIGGANKVEDGFIQYGSVRIDQRVRVATPARDYMTTWASFFDVQNAADVRGRETYEGPVPFRFITTPRDLATYVHFDALYEAYLNACLIMLSARVPFDKGIPFGDPDKEDKQEGFAQWGGPHILTLVTEVATRALKAVRYSKFNIHRRLRPEAVAGILDRHVNANVGGVIKDVGKPLAEALGNDLIKLIQKENAFQNKMSDFGVPRKADFAIEDSNDYTLLPMAFVEGSPMHPSYGSGHATVAGACVTVLKAFFDTTCKLDKTFVVNSDGSGLVDVTAHSPRLTIEGELNKLASNISIGRNWAGVHYFSDYFESILLGEEVAIGILEEQVLQYGESFSMTIPLFSGGEKVIGNTPAKHGNTSKKH